MNQRDDCIFCKIVAGKAPSFKIRENDDFLAFLDIFPNTKGQALLIPKNHYDSDVFEVKNGDFYKDYMLAAEEVVSVLKKTLNVQRVAMVMEGMGVNHVHLKLYPLHGVEGERKEMIAEEEKYFDHYEGYLSTQPGPKADFEVLGELAMHINNANLLN